MATPGEATLPAEGGARPKATHPAPDRRVRGPTLSTSTSSFEALDPHDPQLNHLASVMFSKSADWISGELSATVEDYKLLEKMNKYVEGVVIVLNRTFFWLNESTSFFPQKIEAF